MKLYYSPGACSLASHIILREVGAEFAIEKVDLRAKVTESGADYWAVNAKGSVPALALAEGAVLTEGVAIMQYIPDAAGHAALSPAYGTVARARLQEAMNFVASELHKAYSPLFNPAITDEGRTAALANVTRRLGQVEAMLADGRDYLLGDAFSQADVYAFVVTNWSPKVGVDLAGYPLVQGLRARVAARPAVQAAMKAEGLMG